MLGAPSDPNCKIKGNETFCVLLFLIDLLKRYEDHLGNEGQRLREAGECLEGITEMLKGIGDRTWVVHDAVRQRCLDMYARSVSLMEGDDCYTPKFHQMLHLIFKTGCHGNPSLTSTWHDEALNKVLKGSCRHVSQLTFERSVLFAMREILSASWE